MTLAWRRIGTPTVLEYPVTLRRSGVLPGGGKGVKVTFWEDSALFSVGEWEEFCSVFSLVEFTLEQISVPSDSLHST